LLLLPRTLRTVTTKTCSKCGVEKDISEFGKRSGAYDGLKGACRPCENSRNKQYRTPDKSRVWSLKWRLANRYGIKQEDFTGMMEAQGYKCAICSDELDFDSGKFAVDHNHTTGDVRGILCPSCNHGIGKLKDNPSVLRSAAQYLETRGYYG